MSKNPGNTGHHGYKLSKLVDAEIVGNQVRHKLECGHTFTSAPAWVTIEQYAELIRLRIGKRQRCNQCQREASQCNS